MADIHCHLPGILLDDGRANGDHVLIWASGSGSARSTKDLEVS